MVVGSTNPPGPFPHFPVLHGTGASLHNEWIWTSQRSEARMVPKGRRTRLHDRIWPFAALNIADSYPWRKTATRRRAVIEFANFSTPAKTANGLFCWKTLFSRPTNKSWLPIWIKIILTRGGTDFIQKLAVKQLVQPGKRNVSGFPSEWYFAENQRIGNLEFFNTIGQKRLINSDASGLASSRDNHYREEYYPAQNQNHSPIACPWRSSTM